MFFFEFKLNPNESNFIDLFDESPKEHKVNNIKKNSFRLKQFP